VTVKSKFSGALASAVSFWLLARRTSEKINRKSSTEYAKRIAGILSDDKQNSVFKLS
jgi:hypothetical protein